MPRGEPFAYYRRKGRPGNLWKVCECGYENTWSSQGCDRCGKDLLPRPKKRRQRTLDDRLTREGELLDQWVTKLLLAVTKVRYYRRRIKTLEREHLRQSQRPHPTRAIRVRE